MNSLKNKLDRDIYGMAIRVTAGFSDQLLGSVTRIIREELG